MSERIDGAWEFRARVPAYDEQDAIDLYLFSSMRKGVDRFVFKAVKFPRLSRK